MKYFIAVFAAAIFAVGLAEAQAAAPAQPDLSNLLIHLKQYLVDIVDALLSAVTYVTEVFVDRLLCLVYSDISPDALVPSQQLISALSSLPSNSLGSVLNGLDELLPVDLSLVIWFIPPRVAAVKLNLQAIVQQLQATGQAQVPLSVVVKAVGAAAVAAAAIPI